MPARWATDRESAGFLKERINLGAGGDDGPCATAGHMNGGGGGGLSHAQFSWPASRHAGKKIAQITVTRASCINNLNRKLSVKAW